MELESIKTSLNPLIGHFYDVKLSQSIQSLLSQFGNENTESSQFLENFYELIQARVDPPLESIWVYVSLAFRTQNPPKNDDILGRISSAKRLFQLIQSCSSSFGSSKSVALVAPVVYEVYNVVAELFEKKEDLSSKRVRKAMKEAVSLVEAILGYISICSSKAFVDEDEPGRISGFSDLVRIWVGSSLALDLFLPLVSSEVCGKVGEESCEVSYLAGVVVFEAFLLKLCLSLRNGISNEDLVNELRTWAVGSITGFGNFYFFEILVRFLLEKTLPHALLLNSEDEVSLRKVLYDAVLLVDYYFLNPERTNHLPAERVRSLAMARLLVAHEGVVYFRERGDQKKSISYVNAFSNSSLASQITKWINNRVHVKDNVSKSHGSSPTALTKWLVNLQDQGIQVFGDTILKTSAELVRDSSRPDIVQPTSKLVDNDLLFFIDNKGEELGEEEKSNEATNAAFLSAARSMKSSSDGGGQRRKGLKSAQKKKRVKFVKYETLLDSEAPRERSSGVSYNNESSGSEVEDPVSDNDSDQNEQ